MTRTLFAGIALLLGLSPLSAGADDACRVPEDLSPLLECMRGHQAPTLADYERLFARVPGEDELVFVLEACRSRGWEAQGEECLAYWRARIQKPSQAPSLYLAWLKRQLDWQEPFQIKRVEAFTPHDGFDYRLITAEVGSSQVVFYCEHSSGGPSPGVMMISTIDGKQLNQLLREDLESEDRSSCDPEE